MQLAGSAGLREIENVALLLLTVRSGIETQAPAFGVAQQGVLAVIVRKVPFGEPA